ncbi:MAG: alpha/beta fold hydrolase [Actinomycetota bacterium]
MPPTSTASFVRSDGARLAFDVVGEGEPVAVVGHGLTGSRRDFALLAPFMPGTTVLFDFRGHGDSERPPAGAYTMDHFAGDVDRVAAAHGATAVVGVSLGGGATLRLLTRTPDRFERLVFLLPARLERSDAAHRRLLRLAALLESRSADEVADVIVAEEDAMGVFDGAPGARDRRRAAILAMNRDGIPHAIRGCIDDPPIRDATPLAGVTAPALVIGQEGDPVHDAAVARELAGSLPNAELVMFGSPREMLDQVIPLTQRVAAFLAG